MVVSSPDGTPPAGTMIVAFLVGIVILAIGIMLLCIVRARHTTIGGDNNQVLVDIDELNIHNNEGTPTTSSAAASVSALQGLPFTGTLATTRVNPVPPRNITAISPSTLAAFQAAGYSLPSTTMRTTTAAAGLPTIAPLLSGGMARITDGPVNGGLMSTPEAQEKKWNPQTYIPDVTRSVRPKGSLADQFGPDPSELAAYLPTASQMFKAKTEGPKKQRVSHPVRSLGDFRPLVVPQDYSDYSVVTRGNRPRINQGFYEERLKADAKFFGTVLGVTG